MKHEGVCENSCVTATIAQNYWVRFGFREVNINNSWIRQTLAIAENNQSGERTGVCILTHARGSVKHNSDIIIVYHS